MKKIFLFFFIICCTSLVRAQVSPDMQKQMDDAQKKLQQMQNDPATQEKMQRAQKLMDSLKADPKTQQQMKQAQQQLDALKKTHPELAGVNLPDLNNTKAPDLNKTMQAASNGLKQSFANLQNMQQSLMGALPKEDISRHATTLPVLKTTDIKLLAQGIISSSPVDMVSKQNLNKLAKDTTINVAGTGIFYLSLGLTTNACGYLIAKGIMLRPRDPYAASGLGVYFRDVNSPDIALQCFFYANKLLPDSVKSPYVYANIAWASAYYGDFSTAKIYFEKALSLSSSFKPALEGEATLAYAKGDTKALFACLAKELLAMTKTAGGGSGGDAGPSGDFTATCGGATDMEKINDAGSKTQSDPSDDHTYDGLGDDDEGPDQDPPPGGDVTYPEIFKPVFVNNIKDVSSAILAGMKGFAQANQIITNLYNKYIGTKARFYGQSYFDEHGDLRHDRDYTKFANLHAQIGIQFERRVAYHIKESKSDFDNFYKQVINAYENIVRRLGACTTQECVCMVINQANSEGNNFLNNGATMWEKTFDKVSDDIKWYLKNDAAFVTRVHDPACNEVLNIGREMKVRTVLLTTYGLWFDVLKPLNGYAALAPTKISCPAVQMGMMGSPDPFSKRPKHIKEFPDKNCTDKDYWMVFGTVTDGCTFTKFTLGLKLGPGTVGAGYSTKYDPLTGEVKDPIASENNNFDHSYNASIGLGAKFGEVIEMGIAGSASVTYGNDGQATGYTGSVEGASAVDGGIAKLGGKASYTWQWDDDMNITGHSISVSAGGSIGGNANNLGPNQPENAPGAAGGGPTLNGEISSSSSYDDEGNYIGGSRSATASAQAGATSNDKSSNSEISTQGTIFGIQSSQNIEVVDGQSQAGPIVMTPK
jgi:tetratricopeptide (TPR) repeat protein